MKDAIFSVKPVWLGEAHAQGIRQKLTWFLDNKTNVRRLKDNDIIWRGSDDQEFIWANVVHLAQLGIWSIEGRPAIGAAPWSNSRLRFCADKEALVRAWLDHPAINPAQMQWQQQLAASPFADNAALQSSPLSIPGRDPQEVLLALAQVQNLLSAGLSLRHINARCFWGDSKCLTEARLRNIFGAQIDGVKPRPLLIDIHLVDSAQGILWVENQDTYLAIVGGALPAAKKFHCVYSKGFQAAAERCRQPESVHFHYTASSAQVQHLLFEQAWFGVFPAHWQCLFWGDLDFSGMAILKSLRKTFPTMSAWLPGYQPMLDLLISGGGHTPLQASKDEQQLVTETGCVYADHTLLPALQQLGRFVDQEYVI